MTETMVERVARAMRQAIADPKDGPLKSPENFLKALELNVPDIPRLLQKSELDVLLEQSDRFARSAA